MPRSDPSNRKALLKATAIMAFLLCFRHPISPERKMMQKDNDPFDWEVALRVMMVALIILFCVSVVVIMSTRGHP